VNGTEQCDITWVPGADGVYDGSFENEVSLTANGENRLILYAKNADDDESAKEFTLYNVGISYPVSGAHVPGVPVTDTTIQGVVDAPDFQNYLIQYGEGESPSDWKTIEYSRTKFPGPIPTKLAHWNVRRLNGPHTLRCMINNYEANRCTFNIGQKVMLRRVMDQTYG